MFRKPSLFLSTYLSGGIEKAPEGGKSWRTTLTPFLQSLDLNVYDPLKKDRVYLQFEVTPDSFAQWKTENPEGYREFMKVCVKNDLEIIAKRIDFMVCYLDQYAGPGTFSQITWATAHGIPVYIVTSLPLHKISGWILGCEPRFFCSFEELKQELQKIYDSLPRFERSKI